MEPNKWEQSHALGVLRFQKAGKTLGRGSLASAGIPVACWSLASSRIIAARSMELRGVMGRDGDSPQVERWC